MVFINITLLNILLFATVVLLSLVAGFLYYSLQIKNKLLIESERKNKQIADGKDDILCKTSIDGTIEYASDNYEQIFGFKTIFLKGKNILDFIHSDEHSKLKPIFENPILENRVFRMEFKHKTINDGYKLVEAFCTPNFSESNTLTSFQFIFRDITEQRKQQEWMHFIQFAIDNANQSVVMINPEGEVVYINKRTSEILKRMHKSANNLKIWDFSQDVRPETWPSYFQNLRETKYKVISSEIKTPGGIRFLERHAQYAEFGGQEYIITNTFDLTEYNKAENKLRKNEKIYKAIVENIYDVVWILDLNLNTTYITPSIERLTGYTVDEHLNQSIIDKFTPDSAKQIQMWYEQHMPHLFNNEEDRKNFVLKGELEYKTKDGGTIWTEMTIKMLLDEKGEITGMHGTSVNIDERKRSEIDLRSSREKYKSIYENIIDVYYETSPDGILLEISPSIEKHSKFKREEVIGKNILCFYKNPEQRALMLAELKEKGKLSNFEITFVDKDNREIESSLTSTTVYDENGHVTKICGTIRDISERKAVNRLIMESEDRYRSLVNLSPNTIAVSRNGKLIYVNPAGIAMLGHDSADQVIGSELLSHLHPDDHENVLKYFYNYDKSFGSTSFEVRVIKKDGNVIYTMTSIQPIAYSDEPAMLIVSQDITKQKQNEIEIYKAKQKAEESDKLKTAFLANMSHEIRTPLNGIIGFAGLLKKSNLPSEKVEHYTSIINSSSHQLLAIINDIIDISKIEAGQMIVINDAMNLNHLLNEINAIYKTLAEKRGLDFKLTKGLTDEKSVVICDELKLKQILNNLINNALKFTSQGGITLGYELKNNDILFTIRDTGIGIPLDYQHIIFERFRQVEISNNRKYGGTGLGLSISKALIELLNGQIWLESIPEVGTTFYFTLPYMAVKPENFKTLTDSEDLDDYYWGQKTILIAEDENMNYFFLEELMRDTGVKLLHAANGLEAIELFKKHKEVDLILLDIKMPEMDGYEALKIIKKYNPKITVIAQTAFAMSNDKDKALARGFDDYIPKPIEKDEFLSIINRYLFKPS